MFKLLKKLKPIDCLAIVVIFGLIVTQVFFDLKMPDYTQKLTTKVAGGGVSMSDVYKNGGMMMLCAVASLGASILCGYFCARLSANLSARIRGGLYDQIMAFSNVEMKKFSTASLLTRSTNDVEQVQGFFSMGLQILIKAPVTAIWAISKISTSSIEWTMATVVCVAVILVSIVGVVLLVLPRFKKIQWLIDNLNAKTRENVSGIRVVRAFNAEKFQTKKFEVANDDLTKNQLFIHKMMGLLSPILTVCMNGLSVAVYWIGAVLINKAPVLERALLLGNMTAFIQYAMQIVMSFVMLVVIFVILPRAIVSAKRINEVLECEPSIKSGNFDGETKTRGEIEFKNVSFRYPDGQANVLENLNFKIKSGETVAIIGATGSGKTTLIDLIPRFNEATSGEVLVDGVNVKDYKFDVLQNKISVASQKACLFKGDIEENIAFGETNVVNKEKIENALKIAESEFVFNQEKTIHAEVSQGGTNFSGGQKQRLSIARAVFKDSEIVIFDDSFSALDYKTDSLVRKNIKENLSDRTVLIVAQRIGTILNADKILVLKDGKIVGEGTHEELLKSCQEYQEIALSQLSKEEL